MAGRLHELLAVEGDLGGAAKKLIGEAITTFSKRADHFMGQTVRYEHLDEDRVKEDYTDDHAMVTTVSDKLRYLVPPISKHIDALMQKDLTNTEAVADLVVDGTVIAENLPATFLLGLESYLQRLRAVYNAIPTLKPGIRWESDPTQDNVFIAPEQTAFRAEKVKVHKIVVDATEHHPAQIDMWYEDRKVARIIKTETSGTLTPLAKSKILGRVDTLIRAAKKARQRANRAEIVKRNLGSSLFDYIHGAEV